MWKVEKSKIDSSVNFIKNYGKSFVECRYVRREDRQVICYLSSHNGCNLSCRMCHLTASGQTENIPVTVDGYVSQAVKVLEYWHQNERNGKERIVNYNFMARGDAFNNPFVKTDWFTIQSSLDKIAKSYNINSVCNISTIIPSTFNYPLFNIFDTNKIKIYWSLYSPNAKFRKRWLPKSKEPNEAAQLLNNYREYGGKVVLHNAFIKNENDTEEQIKELYEFIRFHDLVKCDFNIVRYNSYSERHGEESERIDEIYNFFENNMLGRVQIIDRIGKDAHASCGMFLES